MQIGSKKLWPLFHSLGYVRIASDFKVRALKGLNYLKRITSQTRLQQMSS